MRYVQTPAGRSIMEQGERGTSFYVCDSGEFKAEAYTRPVFSST
jgi:CRP-like cAMP-binding protein